MCPLKTSLAREINDAVSKITVEGARYPAHLQQRISR